jgi:hypothetical protein
VDQHLVIVVSASSYIDREQVPDLVSPFDFRSFHRIRCTLQFYEPNTNSCDFKHESILSREGTSAEKG